MNLWIAGLAAALLASGAALFYFGTTAADPYVGISVPPPPETDFVPSSRELAANTSEQSGRGGPIAAADITDTICTGAESDNFYCYEQHYQKLVREKGIDAAIADLKGRYDKNSYVVAQCHPMTHVIGREAALQFDTPGEAYKYGDGYCWSGYYHGILETFLHQIGRKNLPSKINDVCNDVNGSDSYSFDYYNCVHGLGHGVMALTDTKLFESLDYCELLDGWWEQQSCASGVFMENVIVDGLNHFTDYLDPERPLYPCTDVPEDFKQTCYLMQTSYILKVNGGDFIDTFQWCEKAGAPYRATCLQSLGRDASGRHASEKVATRNVCLLGEDYLEQSNCVIGAVKDIISYFDSDVQAKQFCTSFDDAKLTDICTSTATDYYAQF